MRHKKRTAYVIDDKYMVTVTAIQEYFTHWQKLPKGKTITVNFEDLPEHCEVEVSNQLKRVIIYRYNIVQQTTLVYYLAI